MLKRCSKCKEDKPLGVFGTDKRALDGKRSWCKLCQAEDQRKYSEVNPEKISEYKAKYRADNLEKIRERSRKYYEVNSETRREYGRKYRADNPEKISEYRTKYRADNLERDRERGRNYRAANLRDVMLNGARHRAKRANRPCTITPDDIVIPTHCPILGLELKRGTNSKPLPCSPSLDKIVPELGYVPGNIQVISNKANAMKNNATLEEMVLLGEWAKSQIACTDTVAA